MGSQYIILNHYYVSVNTSLMKMIHKITIIYYLHLTITTDININHLSDLSIKFVTFFKKLKLEKNFQFKMLLFLQQCDS